MLSRTAASLFWLSRYMERAESVARTVLVAHRMANMALSLGDGGNEWASALLSSGCDPTYRARHGEVDQAKAIDFLVRDPDNPSSILSCLATARRNARAVRTALTVDMWEALNETWLQARVLKPDDLSTDRLVTFLEWVKQRNQLFSGAGANTMLRNDAFWFTRLGMVLERADNTARILDVKYHLLLPEQDGVGGILDYYQWQAILRAVSALRSYHWVYHDRLKPWLVAELLILRPEMPRSLVACTGEVEAALDCLSGQYRGRRGECHRLAGEMNARLRFGRIDDIFQTGLHEFLTDFIDDTVKLGEEISAFYLTA
jgi:uncharacterized alpha-E superfamily protein